MSLNVARLADRQAGRRRRRVLAAILAAALAAVAAFVHVMDVREASRHRARIEAYQLAHYASARPWQHANGAVCPPLPGSPTSQLEDDGAWPDRWGRRYWVWCQAIDGTASGVVVALGEDGELGTDDDLVAAFGAERR